jgi:Fic family protein
VDLDARYALGEEVVRRAFAEEMIMLNLETGQYYGLNPTAAVMLDKLVAGASPRAAAAEIAAAAHVPTAQVEADIEQLLADLTERRLIRPDG